MTWFYSNGGSTITIQGAATFGNTVPMTVTVPSKLGHSAMPLAQVINVPALGGVLPGSAQVTVAP